jgi:hypothetical protein
MSSKILLAQPKHRGAKHLGRAADEVMDTWLEPAILILSS